MISEPLNVAGHKNYPEGTEHGYSATIGGDIGSFHHNLLAHAEGRSWSMGGGTDFNGNFAGRLDIRNNVVYNFGKRVNDGGAHKVNFVGNLYKQGPASSLTIAMKAQVSRFVSPTRVRINLTVCSLRMVCLVLSSITVLATQCLAILTKNQSNLLTTGKARRLILLAMRLSQSTHRLLTRSFLANRKYNL